mmetsp:Transcript_36710/g.89066  ORF Transcript_36710/g.89066 Transcript_36710/m.89066 type:complete len:613 (-) Transcript_36710:113-1951(-)
MESRQETTTNNDDQEPFVYTGQPAHQIPRTVTHVIVAESVLKIKKNAFEDCILLEEVQFNRGLQIIGDNAFRKCFHLQTVSLPVTLEKIGKAAFSRSSLIGIDLLHVKDIGSGAFSFCDSLVDVYLPEGLVTISDSLFYYCEALRQITIPSTVEVIGTRAFAGCNLLENVKFNNKLEIIGNGAFTACESLSAITLPPTLVRIGEAAFYDSPIAQIHLPEGLLFLGSSAFACCRELRSVKIPSTLERIEYVSFAFCSSLTEVHFQEGLKTIGQKAFLSCTLISAIALPRSLCVVEAEAFCSCKSLLGVELPMHPTDSQLIAPTSNSQSVCFSSCNNLVNVCIPTHLSSSTDEAFKECKRLRNTSDGQFQPEKLRSRFVNLPIHEVCYYASTTTVDDLSLAVESSSSGPLIDPMGMTPLHIVATSAQLRADMMTRLLDNLPVNCRWSKDKHGRTVMDYLLFHNSERAVPLIKMVLRKAIEHEMNGWGMKTWTSDLSCCVEDIPCGYDLEDRRQHVDMVVGRLSRYLGVEITSIVELAIWKVAIHELARDDQEHQGNRTDCRMRCGSDVVLGNVIEYLWDTEPETSLSSAFVPSCSSLYGVAIDIESFEIDDADS